MSKPEHQTKMRLVRFVAEAAVLALVFASLVTACGWLWVGKTSPFNHGVAPDVHTSPSVALWVVLTLPAAILFVNGFGKRGAEWEYFLCVFSQWFVLGLAVGGLVAAFRRAIRTG